MISFRLSTENESKLIQNAIDNLFGEKIAEKVIHDKYLILAEGKWTEIFLISRKLLEIFEKIIDKKHPYCLGLFLGELRNKKFKLSLELVFEITKYTSHKVQLTEHGAQSFLYAHDVPFSAVDKIWYAARKGDYAILLDENGFPIGLGTILYDLANVHKNPSSNIWIRNIIDRGWYLRKGR